MLQYEWNTAWNNWSDAVQNEVGIKTTGKLKASDAEQLEAQLQAAANTEIGGQAITNKRPARRAQHQLEDQPQAARESKDALVKKLRKVETVVTKAKSATSQTKLQPFLSKLATKPWGKDFIEGMMISVKTVDERADQLHELWSTLRLTHKQDDLDPACFPHHPVDTLVQSVEHALKTLEDDGLADAKALKS